nr:MAG TPA_asm: hypothetical protein [Caudoviricetes sp.]
MNELFYDISMRLKLYGIYTHDEDLKLLENQFNSSIASLYLHLSPVKHSLFFHIPNDIRLNAFNHHIKVDLSTDWRKIDISEIPTVCEEYAQKFFHYSSILQDHISPMIDAVNRQLDCITDRQAYAKYRSQAVDEIRMQINSIEEICSI